MNVAAICKRVAKIIGIVGALGSFFLGIFLFEDGYGGEGFTFCVFLVGALSSGLYFLLLYALGEIVEKLHDIDYHVSQVVNNSYEIGKTMGAVKK